MLGIDIYDNEVRIVQLRCRGGSYLWLRAVTAPLEGADFSDPRYLGQKLTGIIQENGWSHQKAVLTLHSRSFFIKYFDESFLVDQSNGSGISRFDSEAILDAVSSSILVSTDDMIFDFRNSVNGPGDSGILLAGVERSVVHAYSELVSSCGVKVMSLDLRCLAAVNGLREYWADSSDRLGVVFVEGGYADLAIFDSGQLVSLHPMSVDETVADAQRSKQLLDEVSRLLRTMRLSSNQVPPGCVFLACGEKLFTEQLCDDRDEYERRLAVPVVICSGPSGFILGEDIAADDFGHYLPALGAGLDGLGGTIGWFDFLHPRGKQPEKKRTIVWQPVAFLLIGLIILSAIFWISLVQQRKRELADLRSQIDATKPERQAIEASRASWTLFRPYVPLRGDGRALDGSRREYLRVLGEINKQFPDPNVAYVTNLSISDGVSSSAGGTAASGVSIRGRVSQGDVLPGFIDRLNESWMFQEARQASSLTRDDSDSLYPHTFSVTCSFRRAIGGREGE